MTGQRMTEERVTERFVRSLKTERRERGQLLYGSDPTDASLASLANALRKFCSWMPGHDDEEDRRANSGTGRLTYSQKDSLGMRSCSFADVHPIRVYFLRFTASTMFQSGAPHSRLQDLGAGRPCFISIVEQPLSIC
jgi:hypothetical protein